MQRGVERGGEGRDARTPAKASEAFIGGAIFLCIIVFRRPGTALVDERRADASNRVAGTALNLR